MLPFLLRPFETYWKPLAHATMVKEKRNAYRKRVAEAGGPLRAKGITTSGGGRGRTSSVTGTPTGSSSQPHKGSETGDDEELDEIDDEEDADVSDVEVRDNNEAEDTSQPVPTSVVSPPLPQEPTVSEAAGAEAPKKRKLILRLGPNKAVKSTEPSPNASPQPRNHMELE